MEADLAKNQYSFEKRRREIEKKKKKEEKEAKKLEKRSSADESPDVPVVEGEAGAGNVEEV
jgi:sugar-specific transcriptional regulator TrmB